MSLIPTREQEEFNKLFPVPNMTTKGEWVAYTGSDEQIAELQNARHGYVLQLNDGVQKTRDEFFASDLAHYLSGTTHYWIIPDDPLREMKLRHDATGQPVWIRWPSPCKIGKILHYCGTNINWNIPNAEYSFKAFEE